MWNWLKTWRGKIYTTLLILGTLFIIGALHVLSDLSFGRGMSAVRGDFRSQWFSIESYRSDHGVLPMAVALGNPPIMTPHTNIDPFNYQDSSPGVWNSDRLNGNRPFGYLVEGKDYLVHSPGVDGDVDLSGGPFFESDGTPTDEVIQKTYDPTNGNWSSGDLMIVGSTGLAPGKPASFPQE